MAPQSAEYVIEIGALTIARLALSPAAEADLAHAIRVGVESLLAHAGVRDHLGVQVALTHPEREPVWSVGLPSSTMLPEAEPAAPVAVHPAPVAVIG